MAGFVIELTHKEGKKPAQYICAIPVPDEPVETYSNTMVKTLAEAAQHPYSSAEVAAAIVASLPPTKNTNYRVIEVATKSAKAKRAKYTEDDLEAAFTDGVTVGFCAQDGTYGTEDFMGLETALKAEEFLKREIEHFGSWQDLWCYCGGAETLYGNIAKGERSDRAPKKRKAARAGK